MKEHNVLVVDDDPQLNEMLSTALDFAGYNVRSVGSAAAALAAAAEQSPHVIVLDVNLPDHDGFWVCDRLRDRGDTTPIIFLTARDGSDDVMRGLSSGADDYVTKPFQLGELSLRIEAILRRTAPTASSVLSSGALQLDEDAYEVHWQGQPIPLTPREFALLRYLLVNAERVLSKQQIADAVWGATTGGDDNLVETYVSRLRAKLGDGASKLKTVRGFGYVLKAQPETDS